MFHDRFIFPPFTDNIKRNYFYNTKETSYNTKKNTSEQYGRWVNGENFCSIHRLMLSLSFHRHWTVYPRLQQENSHRDNLWRGSELQTKILMTKELLKKLAHSGLRRRVKNLFFAISLSCFGETIVSLQEEMKFFLRKTTGKTKIIVCYTFIRPQGRTCHISATL